tara:strand:+ start:4648 stop:5004 length:357 start_codon:yes stop_codon:yes gene_type:complete
MQELELFDLAPKEKHGEIDETEIEYLVIAFDANKKREMIRMLEHLCDEANIKAYAKYLFKIVGEKYEEIKIGTKVPLSVSTEKEPTIITNKPPTSLEENIEAIDWKLQEIYNIIKEKP